MEVRGVSYRVDVPIASSAPSSSATRRNAEQRGQGDDHRQEDQSAVGDVNVLLSFDCVPRANGGDGGGEGSEEPSQVVLSLGAVEVAALVDALKSASGTLEKMAHASERDTEKGS